MLKSISNLKGIKKLNKKEQANIKAGDGWTITCSFPDGNNWEGHSDDIQVAAQMMLHCEDSGGTESHSYYLPLVDFFVNHL